MSVAYDMAATLEMLQGEGGFSSLSGCGEFDPTCGPLRLASLRYDYRDQMVEYEETFGSGAFMRFQYDALGRRVSRLSLDSAAYYVQGGQGSWQVLAEYDGASSTALLKADYAYGNFIDEPVQMRRDYDGAGSGTPQTFYYHQDDLFNVVALTAGPDGASVPSLGVFASGEVVERYGYGNYGLPAFVTGDGAATLESARTGNPYLFTGREWDGQTRLYHYRTRYMEPTWGRFTTRDTIGIWGDLANRGNGYEYVGGGPGYSIDPYGQQSHVGAPFAIKGGALTIQEALNAGLISASVAAAMLMREEIDRLVQEAVSRLPRGVSASKSPKNTL